MSRVILGPLRCQGCGREVVWMRDEWLLLGWLHEHGEYRCPKPGPKPTLVQKQRGCVPSALGEAGAVLLSPAPGLA